MDLPPITEEDGEIFEDAEKHDDIEQHDDAESTIPWVGVSKGNHLPTHGIKLPYVAPSIVDGELEVNIDKEDVKYELQFWDNALIMYALGEELSMNAVKHFMSTVWNFVALPEHYYNDEGYFLIRFRSPEDRDVVFLHQWTPEFTLKDDLLRVLPIWVVFPQLPLMFWGENSLGKIASALGKTLITDECSSKKLSVSYERVLIEVDFTMELRKFVTSKDQFGL